MRVKNVAICRLDIFLAVIICEAAVVSFSTVVSISNCTSVLLFTLLVFTVAYFMLCRPMMLL